MGREVGKVILEREREKKERKRFGCGSCSGESGFWERDLVVNHALGGESDSWEREIWLWTMRWRLV